MKHLFLLTFLLSACTTTAPEAQPAAAPAGNFSAFPRHFTAIQGLTVNMKGDEKTVIASLRRDEHDYHVTFLHPAFQTPLLELKTYGPEDQRTRYFVEKERLPFDPQLILRSIVALYEAKQFSGNKLHTDDADYLLAEVKSFAGCTFPARIELTFNATKNQTLPQVLPRLTVATKELECK
jgi:hypothetical protein